MTVCIASAFPKKHLKWNKNSVIFKTMMKNNLKNKSQSLLKELQSLQLPEHEQFVKGFYFPS